MDNSFDSDADSIQPSPQIQQGAFNSGASSYTSPEPVPGSSPPAEQILGKTGSKKETLRKFFKGPYEELSSEQNEGGLKYDKRGEDEEYTEALTKELQDEGYDYQYNYGDPYAHTNPGYGYDHENTSASSFQFGDESLTNDVPDTNTIRANNIATVVPSTTDVSRGIASSGKYQQRLADDAAIRQQEYEDTFKVSAQDDRTGSGWAKEDPSRLLTTPGTPGTPGTPAYGNYPLSPGQMTTTPGQMLSPGQVTASPGTPNKFANPPPNAYKLNLSGVSSLDNYNQKLAQELDFDKYCKKDAPRGGTAAATPPAGRVVTKAQYENYRRASVDLNNTLKAEGGEEDGSDDEDFGYEDSEQLENAKMRAKQQAHLAVYRQKMMKVTGAASTPAFKTPPMAGQAFVSPSSDSDDDLDDVPLGILQAHGFPRDSQRLKTMSSDTNLSSHIELAASPMMYSKSASTSPMFKSRDTDAMSVNSASSRNMPFGRSRLSGVPHPLLSGPQPNRGLVAEIAREEKEKIKRKSGIPSLAGGMRGGYAGSMNDGSSVYEAPPPGGLQAQMAQLMQMQMQMQMTLQQQVGGASMGAPSMGAPSMGGMAPGMGPASAAPSITGLKHRWSTNDLSAPNPRFAGDNASIASGGSGMSNRSRYRPGFNVRAFNRSSTAPELPGKRVMSQTHMPVYTEDDDDDEDDDGWREMAEQRRVLRDQWRERGAVAI